MKRNVFVPLLSVLCWIAFLWLGTACNPNLPSGASTQTSSSPRRTSTHPAPSPSVQPLTSLTDTPEPQKSISVDPQALKGLVIRFWHNWSGPSGDVIASLVENFNTTNPWGILAVEIYQGSLDEIDSKLSSLKGQADRPDLLVGYLHQALVWDKDAGLIDLNEYLLDPIWGFQEDERADFYPIFLEYDFSQGKRLGIPAQRSGYVLYYNQSWARELGFNSAPLSAEIFLQQACAAAEASRAMVTGTYTGVGGWAISLEYPAVLSWMMAFDAKIYQETGTLNHKDEYSFDQPKVLQTYEFLRKMFDRGCAWLPENPYPATNFAERKALFASGSITDLPFFLDAMQRAGNHDQWTLLAYPGPKSQQAIDVYGTSFLVTKSSDKQQLAAWLLIKWLLQPENQERLLQTTQAFPLRIPTGQAGDQIYAWKTGIDLLTFAQVEPVSPSWNLVRWAISDSATQLFRSYTTLEQTPALVKYLDQTVEELSTMVGESQ